MAAVASNTTKQGPIMLSYNDSEELTNQVYQRLKKKLQWPVWLDKHDAKSSSLSSSIAETVQTCSAVVCFLTPVYENTPVCERELTYAANLGKPIIPCLVGRTNVFDHPDNGGDDNDDEEEEEEEEEGDWLPGNWLGLLVADLLTINFKDVDKNNIDKKCDELIKRIQNVLEKKPAK